MGMFLNRGKEEFERVVNSEIYVDKTEMIEFFNKVIETEQAYVCVSRPRRFGKTMAANMIAAYFEKGSDSRSLFEGRKLSLHSGWDKNMNKYDVIRIDIADIFSRRNDANEALNYIEKGILEDLAEVYTDIVNVQEDKIADVLDRINSRTGTKFVIIDEWDAFFRDNRLENEVQIGYLAFDSEKSEAYIPNKEVRMCFKDTLGATGWDELVETLDNSERLLEATIAGDSEEVAAQIDECHMKIVDKPAMIIELKWKKNAGTSIKQIKDKNMLQGLKGIMVRYYL